MNSKCPVCGGNMINGACPGCGHRAADTTVGSMDSTVGQQSYTSELTGELTGEYDATRFDPGTGSASPQSYGYYGYYEQTRQNKKSNVMMFLLACMALLLCVSIGACIYLITRGGGNSDDSGSHSAGADISEELDTAPPDDEQDQSDSHIPNLSTYGYTTAKYFDPTRNYYAGSTFLFGSYEQDSSYANGTEAIEWRVLDTEGDRLLAISVYGLDCKKYNETKESVTWSNCDLRAWLNQDFYEEAFDSYEQDMILETTLINPANPNYNVSGGPDTDDKVFILSYNDRDYFSDKNDRKFSPTDYARDRGAYYDKDTGSGYYWLRTPGADRVHVTYCGMDGSFAVGGTDINYSKHGVSVRPVIYLPLS